MSRVRTRFAPSPTGTLHAGNARTAVVNWLIARHHGGQFIVRIEDTDARRNVEGAERRVLEDLVWLGLEWDEGPTLEGGERGGHGPYRQSERLGRYRKAADELLESGRAYRCFCSAEQLEADRKRALAEGRSPGYPGTCRGLAPAESLARAEGGEAHVIRLAVPEGGEVVVEDLIRGRVVFDLDTLDDFVLLRSDGLPTYNFAVVVDDAAMEISHVIRGAGHLSNTPHQQLVYDALGLPLPAFAHTPTVLGEDRSKLSKRGGARPLAELRARGFHPDGVVNYLSLLGWSSPSGDEILSRGRLVEEVTLDRMNAGDVVFDPDKMRWVSGKHIEQLSLDELAAAVRPYLEESEFAELAEPDLPTVLAAVRGHLGAFGEITDHLSPFLGTEADVEPGFLDAEARSVVEEARAALGAADVTWDAEGIRAALREAGKSAGVKGRGLYVPLRRVLTGEEHGPPLHAVIEVQGRERVLGRLGAVLGAGPV